MTINILPILLRIPCCHNSDLKEKSLLPITMPTILPSIFLEIVTPPAIIFLILPYRGPPVDAPPRPRLRFLTTILLQQKPGRNHNGTPAFFFKTHILWQYFFYITYSQKEWQTIIHSLSKYAINPKIYAVFMEHALASCRTCLSPLTQR